MKKTKHLETGLHQRKHSIKTHVQKDRSCDVCLRTTKTKASCRRRTGEATSSRKVCWLENRGSQSPQWGEWIQRQPPSRCRGARRCYSMDSILSVQNKIFTRDGKNLLKFLEPARIPKVVCADSPMEFGRACEVLSWNHRTSTPHRSEAKRAVRRAKEGTSAALPQSGQDERWWPDSWKCYCHLWSVQDLLADGKTPPERQFGKPVRTNNTFWSNGRVSSYCTEISGENSSIWKESIQETFSTMSWQQTQKIWKSWMHQILILEESTQKKCWSDKMI